MDFLDNRNKKYVTILILGKIVLARKNMERRLLFYIAECSLELQCNGHENVCIKM